MVHSQVFEVLKTIEAYVSMVRLKTKKKSDLKIVCKCAMLISHAGQVTEPNSDYVSICY